MNRLELDLFHYHNPWGGEARKTPRAGGLTNTRTCGKLVFQSHKPLNRKDLMLTGNNHQGLPVSTHGFLVGVEIEEGTSIDHIMNRVVDSLSFIEGVGRVEAEHIGEMGDYKSLEEEVMDAILDVPLPTKES